MPRRKASTPTKPLTQTTLFQNIGSSQKIQTNPKKRATDVPKRKRRQSPSPAPQVDSDSDAGDMKFEPRKKDDNEDAESSTEVLRSAKKRRRVAVVSDEDEEGSGSESPTPIAYNKRKGKAKAVQMDISDSEHSIPSPPTRRRKLLKGKRPETPAEASDSDASDDLEEDNILDDRFRARDRKSVFQQNLEKLKRKKQEKSGVVYISSSEQEEEQEEEEASSSDRGLFKGARPTDDTDSLFEDDGSQNEEENEEEDSDNFIVEDDGEAVALPTEFSMEAHEDLAHQFKKIYQFFVHIAVLKPRKRRKFMEHQMKVEEYFSVPLTVARRKISGLRDSLVASSVWRPEFKKSLETYPELDLSQLDFAVPQCDACHLGSRVSTIQGRLSGSPYDRFGFKATHKFDAEEDSDSSTESSGPQREFSFGRFCAKRARVYHGLTHWEYAVFTSVLEEVTALRSGTGYIRVDYGGTSLEQPEDMDDADGICEWLDKRKKIDMEWQLLKKKMDDARHLEMAVKRGEDD